MKTGVDGMTGAGRHERSGEQTRLFRSVHCTLGRGGFHVRPTCRTAHLGEDLAASIRRIGPVRDWHIICHQRTVLLGMDSSPSRHGAIASIFASGNFRRLWVLGGLVNATRWVEVLAAGLFVFSTSGSGLAVAVVLAARNLPMLLLGALMGVVCDSIDRRRVLLAGMLVSAVADTTIAILGAAPPS